MAAKHLAVSRRRSAVGHVMESVYGEGSHDGLTLLPHVWFIAQGELLGCIVGSVRQYNVRATVSIGHRLCEVCERR